MPDLLLDGDLVVFEPTFGTAIAVGALVVPVRGSALATADGRALCVERDVTSVTASVAYSTSSCPVPGAGRLEVTSLGKDQLSAVATSSGEALALATGRIEAALKVTAPASGPPPASTPDTTVSYRGSARFQAVGLAPEAD